MSENDKDRLREVADSLVRQAKAALEGAEELYRMAWNKEKGDGERAAMCLEALTHVWDREDMR